LSPIASIAFDGRADEGDALGLERLGEAHVLGEEAVARMHRLRAGPSRTASITLSITM
jgi:hypothetical protein